MSEEHTEPFETVGPRHDEGGSRRLVVIAVVAAVVAGVLGSGAYAAYAFLDGGGPHPEDVLPASTLGVVSVDLDPSAGQKISAIKSIRKFPALKDALGLRADDDLREYVFDKVLEQGDCDGLDYDDDLAPWLGKRAAFGAVDVGDSDPAPVIALQVSDPDKAEKEFGALVDCTDPEDFAFVVGEDYLVASDSAEHARSILEKGRQHPLADDASYQRWRDEVGDSGVINFYVARGAAKYVRDLVDEFDPVSSDSMASATAGAAVGVRPRAADPVADFRGLAGTIRFADGGMELEVAAGGTTDLAGGSSVGSRVSSLPADTAAALGFGVPENLASTLLDQFGTFADEAESETGMDLPDDLQTLLGDSLSLSLGGDVPDSLDTVDSPDDIPAGLVIHGDAQKIKAVIEKVEDHVGTSLADIPLVLDDSGDSVVIATSQDYADALLESGHLGSADRYRAAVPKADSVSGVIYLDFDSKWRDAIADLVATEAGDDAARTFDENSEPLKSLGISTWTEGSVTHTLVKLATD